MNQKGDYSNNVQIGHAGRDNTFNFKQTQAGFDHTSLNIDESSKQVLKRDQIDREGKTGFRKMLSGGALGAIGYFSEIFGLADYFGIPSFIAIPVGLGIGFIISMPQWFSMLALFKIHNQSTEPAFIENHKIIEDTKDGEILLYSRTAPCIYPNCHGKIILSAAPDREKAILGKSYVGICSVAGRDHSYRVDNIWNAYPEKFDWRANDPNSR